MGSNLENQCQKCIVRATCGEACEDMLNYVKQKVVNFKPKGSPPPRDVFLNFIVQEMRKKSTQILQVVLSFNEKRNVKCNILIRDLAIVNIIEGEVYNRLLHIYSERYL